MPPGELELLYLEIIAARVPRSLRQDTNVFTAWKLPVIEMDKRYRSELLKAFLTIPARVISTWLREYANRA